MLAETPDTVPVACGPLEGVLHVARGCIEIISGGDVGATIPPTEFEKLGGRAASKKWKASIHVIEPDGTPGICIGDWLSAHGLDIRPGEDAFRPVVICDIELERRRMAFNLDRQRLALRAGDTTAVCPEHLDRDTISNTKPLYRLSDLSAAQLLELAERCPTKDIYQDKAAEVFHMEASKEALLEGTTQEQDDSLNDESSSYEEESSSGEEVQSPSCPSGPPPEPHVEMPGGHPMDDS